MIPDLRTQEELKRDFRLAKLIWNCPGCGEVTYNGGFSRLTLPSYPWPFGPAWPEAATALSYCPTCDAFIEIWGRNHPEGRCEVSCRLWRWNQDGTAMETEDALFEYQKPSEANVKYMTREAKEKAKEVIHAKWWRGITGPRFMRDDEKFTVCIPKSCAEGTALEEMIKLIRDMMRRKRAARFKEREELPDHTELHFENDVDGSCIVLLMWDSNELPEPVTVWKYNAGRRYQYISWDWETLAPTIHPSRLPPEQRPQPSPAPVAAPRLKPSATVEEALDWLCARLQAIEENHSELTDTPIQDLIHDTLEETFLSPCAEATIPKCFNMDDTTADQKIHRALTSFAKIATPAADARGLSPQQRLDLLNQRPFAELIGFREKL